MGLPILRRRRAGVRFARCRAQRATEVTVSEGELDLRVEHDASQHRYVLLVGQARVGEIVYRMRDGAVELVHTEVDPGHEGEGLGSALVRDTLEQIAARGLRVIPSCPFVAAYIRRHPEFASLVAARP